MARSINTQERILDAAETLFFLQDGITSTGVDKVAARSGVAIATLYKHFGSKENLLREVLSRRLTAWAAHWDAAIAAAGTPDARLLAVFDAVESFRAEAGTTQWCCFLATASERPMPHPGADDSVANLIHEDTQLVTDRLSQLAGEAKFLDPNAVAAALLLLYNGVLGSLLRGAPSDPVSLARTTAVTILEGAERHPGVQEPGNGETL